MPLTHVIWRILHTLGLPVSIDVVWLGLCLAGTLTAIIFLGLIAADLLRTRTAAWLAAMLFGTCLNMWWQWNGELYALALGFLTAAVFLALRSRLVAAACLWALAVACHIDFALAAPLFIACIWMRHPIDETLGQRIRRTASVLVGAGTLTVLIFIALMWAMGKFSHGTDLGQWGAVWSGRLKDSGHVLPTPEVFRATKGLLTAFTVAGHYWRDILTGRGPLDDHGFVLASAVGLVVLVATGTCLAAAAWTSRVALFAVVWILPFEMFFNWWFVPNDSKYHAGALPGFILLVTAGLLHLTRGMTKQARWTVCAVYIVASAGLNLFGSLLPMRAFGADTIKGRDAIRQLNTERGGRAVFVSCTDSEVVAGAGVENERIKRIWKKDPRQTQEAILSWVRARGSEGKEPFVLDRSCRPDEWFVPGPPPFDLNFLQRDFEVIPTPITGIPVARVWETNPFSWRRGDVFRLVLRR